MEKTLPNSIFLSFDSLPSCIGISLGSKPCSMNEHGPCMANTARAGRAQRTCAKAAAVGSVTSHKCRFETFTHGGILIKGMSSSPVTEYIASEPGRSTPDPSGRKTHIVRSMVVRHRGRKAESVRALMAVFTNLMSRR